MATVRVKFRVSSVDMREGTLFYQIIHNRVTRRIHTSCKLYASEWDAVNERVVPERTTSKGRLNSLMALNSDVRRGLSMLTRIISNLDKSGKAYTAEHIVAQYEDTLRRGGFLAFIDEYVIHLRKAGRQSSATKLHTALNSFRNFLCKEDLPFDEVTPDLLEEYEGWLKRRGDCLNTVSFYMRQLRPVYSLAVEHGLTEDSHPFKHVYTGIDKTVKRAVPITVIRRIQHLDLSDKPHLDRARDLFFFSLYTRGMSFVDMYNLKKTDLKDGMLTYRRQKTHQLMMVKWEKPMQQILDKLGKTDGKHLLPIMKDNGIDEATQRTNALHRFNRNLKTIGRMIGIEIGLTSYVARHTWASLAQSNNIPISTISKGLGHDSETTTKIYLAFLDTTVVDRANHKILSVLNNNNDC